MELGKGIIPALLTPFTETEEVDYEALRAHTRSMVESGVQGIFCLGTNGEFYALTESEKLKITETVVDEVNGKIPVYAGSGEISTRTVIRLTNAFQKLGVSAVSVITPYFIHPSQHELYEHYGRIARETQLPVILYNIPMRTHVNLEPETVADLARDFPGIIGMKDSSGDIERIKRIIDITPGSFKVLSGDDGLILDTLLLGGTGAISGTANVIPDILVNLYGAFLEGDIKKARMLQDRIAPLRADGKLGTSPGVVKLQANLAGCPVGKCRMPIRMDDPETVETIRKNLKRYYGIPTGK